MFINELQQDVTLCLLAIKQAHAGSTLGSADQMALQSMFTHGFLYQSILVYPALCEPGPLANIQHFRSLVQSNLQPPVITGVHDLSLKLSTHGHAPGTESKWAAMNISADKLYRATVVYLASVFQLAIVDLSMRLNMESELSEVDAQDANYVIGMAEITSKNVESLLNTDIPAAEFNHSGIEKFFADATRFGASLRQRGLGVAA